jgi:hypothetical protein
MALRSARRLTYIKDITTLYASMKRQYMISLGMKSVSQERFDERFDHRCKVFFYTVMCCMSKHRILLNYNGCSAWVAVWSACGVQAQSGRFSSSLPVGTFTHRGLLDSVPQQGSDTPRQQRETKEPSNATATKLKQLEAQVAKMTAAKTKQAAHHAKQVSDMKVSKSKLEARNRQLSRSRDRASDLTGNEGPPAGKGSPAYRHPNGRGGQDGQKRV